MMQVAPMTPPFAASAFSASSALFALPIVVRLGVRVRAGHRLLGHLDCVQRRALAHVGQVDQDAEPIHLANRVDAEVADAVVAALVAAVAQ